MKYLNSILFASVGFLSFGQNIEKDETKRAVILQNPERQQLLLRLLGSKVFAAKQTTPFCCDGGFAQAKAALADRELEPG